VPQVSVPASFYRGGTSRAVIFREADLTGYDSATQEAIVLAAIGSPDP
jgi:2-methylaconitate isomerase